MCSSDPHLEKKKDVTKLEKLQRMNDKGSQMVGLDSVWGVTAGNDSSAQKIGVKGKYNREW